MLPIVAAALLLLPAATAAAGSVPLTRATGPMVEVTTGDQTYSHEKGMPPDDAGAVAAYLRRQGESKPEIVRVPGRKGTFLASDFGGGKPGEEFGRCLILLQSAGGELRELARTRGAGGAHSLTPVVFVGGGRTIVLAELATEYTEGLRVYEVTGTDLVELGEIDAGVPGELGAADPTPWAKMSLEGGRVVVRFEKDLVLGTGKEDAPVAKKPVVFRQGDSGFVHVAGGAAKKAKPSR